MNLLSAALCALAALSSLVAAQSDVHSQLVALAAANNGLIKLDATTYDLLTASKRSWSTSIQLTALDKRRRCAPCKSARPLSALTSVH
jgi:oligosaccharyltransferase complex subunit gamma